MIHFLHQGDNGPIKTVYTEKAAVNRTSGYQIFHKVLPSSRKTGKYEIEGLSEIDLIIKSAQALTGVGYRMDNADGAPGPSQKLEKWTVYLQAMLTMAPGVFLCPEVGYIAFGDTRTGIDAGSQWYLGSKWQVDF